MTQETYGPGFIWVDVDDLVDGCLVDVRVAETPRGWAITDLCISLAPPDGLRSEVDYGKQRPRGSGFAMHAVDSDSTVRGLTSQHLGALRVEKIRMAILEAVSGAKSADPEWTHRINELAASMKIGRRHRRDALWYATIAAAYVEVTADTKRGIYEKMARRLNYAASTLQDAVKEARRAGLLTRPIEGRAGGELTDEATELLERNRR